MCTYKVDGTFEDSTIRCTVIFAMLPVHRCIHECYDKMT